MRRIYVVDPNQPVDNATLAAAQSQNCTEIVNGISPTMARNGVSGAFPFVYVEPDDPELPNLRQAAAVLRNQFGTVRTAAQINNALDAITLILRRIAKAELDRT